MELTGPVQSGDAVYQIMVRTLHFRCEQVPALSAHSAWLWGALKTGQEQAYRKRREQEGLDPLAQKLEKQVEATVTKVLAEPRADQAKWIRRTLDTCEAKAS
jgi:predicted metal-dependent hydrolase